MMMITDFGSLALLSGNSMHARIEVEESVPLTTGICSFENGVFSLGILSVRESDLRGCAIDRVLAEKGKPMLNTALGVAVATLHLRNGTVISLIHV